MVSQAVTSHSSKDERHRKLAKENRGARTGIGGKKKQRCGDRERKDRAYVSGGGGFESVQVKL